MKFMAIGEHSNEITERYAKGREEKNKKALCFLYPFLMNECL